MSDIRRKTPSIQTPGRDIPAPSLAGRWMALQGGNSTAPQASSPDPTMALEVQKPGRSGQAKSPGAEIYLLAINAINSTPAFLTLKQSTRTVK